MRRDGTGQPMLLVGKWKWAGLDWAGWTTKISAIHSHANPCPSSPSFPSPSATPAIRCSFNHKHKETRSWLVVALCKCLALATDNSPYSIPKQLSLLLPSPPPPQPQPQPSGVGFRRLSTHSLNHLVATPSIAPGDTPPSLLHLSPIMDYPYFQPAPQPYQFLGLPPTPSHTHSVHSDDFSNGSPPMVSRDQSPS